MKNRQTLNLLLVFIACSFLIIVVLHNATGGTRVPTKEPFSASDDKLMFFYADWCPHCTSFKPIVSDLKSSHMIHVDMLEDAATPAATKTEYAIQGYPTIYYVSSTKKVKFSGPRTMAGLETFVKTCRQ